MHVAALSAIAIRYTSLPFEARERRGRNNPPAPYSAQLCCHNDAFVDALLITLTEAYVNPLAWWTL